MNKKHNWILGMVLVLLLMVMPSVGHAAQQAHINLNGKAISMPDDVQIVSVKGSVMIPLRVVVEQLGYKVDWSGPSQTATISQGSNVVALVAGSTKATVNGKSFDLEAAPIIQHGTTLVPLRFLAENTGATVTWDNNSKTVLVTTKQSQSDSAGDKDGSSTNGSADSSDKDANTGTSSPSAMVNALSFSDNRLTVTIDGNVKPKYSSLTNPNRIVLDLPKAGFSTAFLGGQTMSVGQVGKLDVTGYPQVAGVRYSLFSGSPSTVRIVLDLNQAQQYKVITNTKGLVMVELNGANDNSNTPGGTVTPVSDNTNGSEQTGGSTDPNNNGNTGNTDNGSTSITPTPGSGPGQNGKKVVVIDPGHGGLDSGAVSLNKRFEKDFTLAVGLKIQALLQQDPNIDFVLTRSDDTYPTLPDRVKLANNLHADVFVSIHGNSTTSKVSPSGTEIYYTRPQSLDFAKVIHDHVVQALGLPDRGIHAKSLHVTRETTMPAVLIEAGYLSNAGDEALMYTDEFQQKLAQAVVDAIKQYLNVQ
ncbi:N-acetylmuramoyl-L-alanine amidase family protein [Paenibacillus campi]|uniref:N-acetylmuramoyl-L-alanine amidase family protein n=1 Tax=Paenibacillus campi TaxID=3106031 RepID=UPI002AFF1CC6|nr:N-acetylmuramoyl-L-alanine amidase family protein [Paenibacillus sp. SGZ-1009]